jgi:hypothetical protein
LSFGTVLAQTPKPLYLFLVVKSEHPYHRLVPVQNLSDHKNMQWIFPKKRANSKPIDTYFATAYINVSMQWATARSIFDEFATSL